MNEETFNLSIRKFLKMVGVNSQREIEQAEGEAKQRAKEHDPAERLDPHKPAG